ncbi:MAG TPA: hypothetical protein EYN91_25430 [Candidatus Melainabacteria bacterium]|nr:hypothetical protein [Candidatus Melainabacteria bacterium]HIN66571.1 hypothetical protein [Candidatus Obscuribacterales bacterium]
MAFPKTGLTGLKLRKENPITKESLSGAAKRFMQHIPLGPVSGNFTDSTTYPGAGGITKPGRLVRACIAFNLAPAGGTNTIALRRGPSAGATILAGASQSVTALAAGTFVELALSANPNDLIFDGTVPINAALVTGTQGTPGNNAELILEFELDDFVAA